MIKSLQCVARWFQSPYATLHVRHEAAVLQDDCHFGSTDPNFWKAGLQDFLTDVLGDQLPRARLLKSRQNTSRVAFLSMPIRDRSGAVTGAMAFVIAPATNELLPGCLAILDAAGHLLTVCEEALWQQAHSSRSDRDPQAAQPAAPTAAMAKAASFSTIEEMAFSITNELRNKYGYEQVALGWIDRKKARILAISGLDHINPRSPGVKNMSAAMEECYDAGSIIGFQQGGQPFTEGTGIYHLHRQWHAAVKGEAVASIPLKMGDRTVAILSLRNRAEQPFIPEHLKQLRSRVEPYMPALLLTQQARRSTWKHVWDSMVNSVYATTAPGLHKRKLGAIAAIIVLLSTLFIPLPYQLTVPCVVSAKDIRTLAAPLDGVLIEAMIVEGDHIQKGDVLCRFDRRALDQELNKLESERQVISWERDRAIATSVPVEAQLTSAKLNLIEARIAIVQRRAEQSSMLAPFDGVVITGDLRKRIGSVISRGETLFEIAPVSNWRLDLQVAQSLIGEVKTGLMGHFITHARPDSSSPFCLERVPPAALAHEGRTIFVAEARIEKSESWLRPGMEGIAKINISRRPLWWQLFHRPVDYLRMKLWL